MCKGADSVILPRLDKSKGGCIDETLEFIEDFAKDGLRTLLLGKRYIPEEEYQTFDKEYQAAAMSIKDREDKLAKCAEKIEFDLELIGSTAIEDKL